jgi:cytochrome b561
MARPAGDAWSAPLRLVHWLIAALVIAQLALGTAARLWRLSPAKLDLFVWHKSIGITVLALMVLRVLVRGAGPTPALPAATPPWERRAAHASHALLYALLFAMPLSGWVINSAANVPLRLFWLARLPAIVAPSKPVEHAAMEVHFVLCVVLAIVVVVHVGAALRHHFTLHDDVLRRMLPFARAAAGGRR